MCGESMTSRIKSRIHSVQISRIKVHKIDPICKDRASLTKYLERKPFPKNRIKCVTEFEKSLVQT